MSATHAQSDRQTHIFDLSNKVAVVTGSGRGLGEAIARGLAAAGATVVTCARNIDEAEKSARDIVSAGGVAIGRRVDVTDRDSVSDLFRATVDDFGQVDVLVNNAGVEIVESADSTSARTWQQTIDTNLTGCFNCAQLAGASMRRRGNGGSIVNVSSMAGQIPMPGLLAYGAAKAGVNQFTRVLAREWGADGIRVNAVAPGFMDNVMRGGEMSGLEKVEALTPLRRRGRPEELVGPVVFLASQASSYVTGAVLYVDGGTSMGGVNA